MAPAHLFLQMRSVEFWRLGPICPIFVVANCIPGLFLVLPSLRTPQHWSWLSDPLHPEVGCGGGSKDPADKQECFLARWDGENLGEWDGYDGGRADIGAGKKIS